MLADVYARGAAADRQRIIDRHYALQRTLQPFVVLVPYAKQLADAMGNYRVEARRAYPQVVSTIVESRCGAVAARLPLRFHTPLIEPDGRISRIRLSDQESRVRPRKALRLGTKLDQSQLLVKVLVSEAERPTRIHFVLSTEPLAKPIPNMIIQCPVRGRHRTEAEVAGPTRQQTVQSPYLHLDGDEYPTTPG